MKKKTTKKNKPINVELLIPNDGTNHDVELVLPKKKEKYSFNISIKLTG